MPTCYDCIHAGTRTVGSLEIACEHPERRTVTGARRYKCKAVTIDTPACDKVFLSHRARRVLALEAIARGMSRKGDE
jgi:hypothetical protein